MPISRTHVGAVVALAATLALSGTAAAARRPAVRPPAGIAKAGRIVFCSDITYPPEEFYRGSTPVGSDIDIGTAIARSMGVKAQFARACQREPERHGEADDACRHDSEDVRRSRYA